MRRLPARVVLFATMWPALVSCATSRHRLVTRDVTRAQWDDVVECLTLSARAANAGAMEMGMSVVVFARTIRNGGTEYILFAREPTGQPEFRVSSRIEVEDPSFAWRAPVSGATPFTRRLQYQLDAQCLAPYPASNHSHTE